MYPPRVETNEWQIGEEMESECALDGCAPHCSISAKKPHSSPPTMRWSRVSCRSDRFSGEKGRTPGDAAVEMTRQPFLRLPFQSQAIGRSRVDVHGTLRAPGIFSTTRPWFGGVADFRCVVKDIAWWSPPQRGIFKTAANAASAVDPNGLSPLRREGVVRRSAPGPSADLERDMPDRERLAERFEAFKRAA